MIVYRLQRAVRNHTPVWLIETSGDGVVAEVYDALLAERIVDMLNALQTVLTEMDAKYQPALEGDDA